MDQILSELEAALEKARDAIRASKGQFPFQGGLRVTGLKVEARDKDGNVTGVIERDALATKQFAQLAQLNLLASAQTIKDTGGASNSETANTAASAPTIAAGTSGTSATVTDFALGAETETQSATINAYSGSGSSGSFTITGTITAGSARAYQEVGLKITVNTHVYLICHDTFSTLNVSSGGTLAVTYTLSWS